MDVIERLPGCDGQATDAVSAQTQVKLENAPRLLKIPKLECPDVWVRLPKHEWPKSWGSIEDPVVPLERNLCGHSLAGLFWSRQFGGALLGLEWEKVPNWECMFVHHKQGLFLSVYASKLVGKKQNMAPHVEEMDEKMWDIDQVFLGCTQRECKPNETNIEQYKKMF